MKRIALIAQYCNFGVNPDKASLLHGSALAISGCDAEGEIRVIELPDHPFFLGTLSAFLRAVV
jgi:CTP synthase (UTP-ammonia lyase)